MNMRIAVLPLLVACCLFVGCADLEQKNPPVSSKPTVSKPAPSESVIGHNRFVPIAPMNSSGARPMIVPWHGFFALDTKTGVLCKTVSHEFPNDAWANQLPLCVGLISAADRPNDKHIESELEKDLDKDLDKMFEPYKWVVEYARKYNITEEQAEKELKDAANAARRGKAQIKTNNDSNK